MLSDQLIPAAQYLRMSTEHQQYSLENQATAIQKYAEMNGFEIVRTYSDPARTGVLLKGRDGLQQLLRDVVPQAAPYRAILVYDVSRWGRFQEATNRRRIQYSAKSKWDYAAVYGILTGLKYIGCHVFGRTSSKLYTPLIRLPKSEWLIISDAFEPIVDYGTFAQAQQILYYRSLNKSDEAMLDALKNLLKREGRLSGSLIEHTDGLPSPSTYRIRFGSLRNAYEKVVSGNRRILDLSS